MPLASVKAEDDDRVSVEPSAVAGISAFLGKLWKMVEDPKTDHLISWGKSGNTFVIKNQIDFAKTILPNYYKHNNIASFIRQLNMYGFHKIISTTSGALDSSDNDEIEFTHPCFVRGHSYLLEQIKRKMNNPKENVIKNDSNSQFNESIKRVFSDIKNLRGKQEHLGSQLCAVKQENEILWRELSLLRQKHAAQQNVLNKLIRFLVSLAQPSSNHSLVKRRLVPLMLKDATSSSKSKVSSYYEGDHVYTVKKREESSPGPTIHEIHPSDMADNVQLIESSGFEEHSPIMVESEIVSSPAPSISNSDISVNSPEPVPAALLLPSKQGIQTMYVTPSQQSKPHFLISSRNMKNDDSPEYLVPDKTDNPLLELVHETEANNGDEYITIVTGDVGNADDLVPGSLIAGNELESALGSTGVNKKRATPRKRIKKEIVPLQTVPKVAAVKRNERKKKTTSSADSVESVLNSNEFLFDLELENEPIIEIQSPKVVGTTAPVAKAAAKMLTLDNLADGASNIPITVEDMINVASPVSPAKIADAPVSNKASATTSPTLTIPVVSDNVRSPLQPPNMVFSVPDSSTTSFHQPSNSPSSNGDVVKRKQNDSSSMMKQISECIDDAQNMKIACAGSVAAPQKTYVDDISVQLDSMQTEIDSLKELIQNEGFTLDSNTFFDMLNQDHLNNYGVPQDFHRPEEGKVEGNELISSQQPMFDLDDFLAQNDWSQTSIPVHADTDYCNLNTPQIEKSVDEAQPIYPPPNKKIRS